MPKFIVTSGQSFMPFSYEELAAPVMQTAELHRATQDVYDQIGMETAALQRYINAETDPRAQEIYQGYLDNLTALQNNLWANGYGPQTRRDLVAARNGYASDVTRLQKAITDRQERSNEYHNIKLEHPDMVIGSDPGLESLDSYLDNDRFGRDYFTYSGNQFTQEVGTDAQARIKEMFEDPELKRLIPGYFSLKEREGVTSADVANARQAIIDKYNGSLDSYNSLDPVAKILADVLDSHIDSTGAQGRISSDEFGRLLEYGAAGLSHAIGETKYQHVDDWQSKLALQHRYAMEEDAYKAALSRAGKEQEQNVVPSYEGILSEVRGADIGKFSKGYTFDQKKYPNGVTINVPGGTTSTYTSPVDLAMDVYNPAIRQNVRNTLHLDVAMGAPGKLAKTSDKEFSVPGLVQGIQKEVKVSAHKATDEEARLYGNGANDPVIFKRLERRRQSDGTYKDVVVVDEDLTRNFNRARKQYQDHVAGYENSNKDLNLKKLAGDMYPANELEIRKDRGYGSDVSTADIYPIEAVKNRVGTYQFPALVTPDDEFDGVRGDYANRIIVTWQQARTSGDLKKGSEYAFKIIGEGNKVTNKETTDLTEVYGKDGKGAIISNGLGYVSVAPEDLVLDDEGNGYPKIRIYGSGTNPIVQTTAKYIGPQAYRSLEAIMPYVTYMMEPFEHPERIASMSPTEASQWTYGVYSILNGSQRMQGFNPADVSMLNGPKVLNNGAVQAVNAKEILYNQGLQDQLRQYIDNYIWDVLKGNLDVKMIDHPQYVNNSSTNAQRLLR